MLEFDAILKDWYICPFGDKYQVVIGKIYSDTKGRFDDGDQVRTSAILHFDTEAGFVKTLNTTYKLEGPAYRG